MQHNVRIKRNVIIDLEESYIPGTPRSICMQGQCKQVLDQTVMVDFSGCLKVYRDGQDRRMTNIFFHGEIQFILKMLKLRKYRQHGVRKKDFRYCQSSLGINTTDRSVLWGEDISIVAKIKESCDLTLEEFEAPCVIVEVNDGPQLVREMFFNNIFLKVMLTHWRIFEQTIEKYLMRRLKMKRWRRIWSNTVSKFQQICLIRCQA